MAGYHGIMVSHFYLFYCLGYIVFSGIRRSSGVQGLRVIVQSDRTPEYVEGRVEAFLHSMKVIVCHFVICQSVVADGHILSVEVYAQSYFRLGFVAQMYFLFGIGYFFSIGNTQ